ncbi:NUDIX hydrolase [Specibacter sp. RAF43]|uniref:NUDIX hydrolase n=1 Tax=Specibacter sp. RAF43 TaxID=3233057 RepID=UPI003F9A5A98
MTAYADLQKLAERARSGDFRVPRPALWNVPMDRAAARPAAVLLLFGALDTVPAASGKPLVSADLDLLLVERAATLSAHPGQIAFPGGGVDPGDASVLAAALREAEEETGLDPSGVEILGVLPDVPVPVSNFIVTPVLGWWARQTPVDVVDFGESAQVFRVPVRDLLDPDNRVTATLTRSGRTYRGPAFTVNGVVVWGFTAGIITHVFDELGWSVPWNEGREIPAPI